jgi:hypothetical protein
VVCDSRVHRVTDVVAVVFQFSSGGARYARQKWRDKSVILSSSSRDDMPGAVTKVMRMGRRSNRRQLWSAVGTSGDVRRQWWCGYESCIRRVILQKIFKQLVR